MLLNNSYGVQIET